MKHVKELTQEAHEIITNARHAEQDGEISKEQADAVIQSLLENIAMQIEFAAFQDAGV
jgi:hypothetical protein